MASPTGGTFRNGYMGPVLARLAQDIVMAWAAAESHESSYSPGNFTALTGVLDDALDAINSAASANESGSNP